MESYEINTYAPIPGCSMRYYFMSQALQCDDAHISYYTPATVKWTESVMPYPRRFQTVKGILLEFPIPSNWKSATTPTPPVTIESVKPYPRCFMSIAPPAGLEPLFSNKYIRTVKTKSSPPNEKLTKCVCDIRDLMIRGCKCGWLEIEKQPSKINDDSTTVLEFLAKHPSEEKNIYQFEFDPAVIDGIEIRSQIQVDKGILDGRWNALAWNWYTKANKVTNLTTGIVLKDRDCFIPRQGYYTDPIVFRPETEVQP